MSTETGFTISVFPKSEIAIANLSGDYLGVNADESQESNPKPTSKVTHHVARSLLELHDLLLEPLSWSRASRRKSGIG